MVRLPPIVPLPIVVMELEVKSVVVVISSCFVPISVMIFTSFTNKSPVIFTLPLIVPPVSSYLLSNAVCSPPVFAMVKSPSCISSCFVPISVITFTSFTN